MTPFDRAFDLLIFREGGWSDDPADPGGATKYGISLRAYSHIGYDGIKNLTREQARALYVADFWNKVRGDELPPGVALCVFDCAVNSGVSRALRMLQGVLDVTVDGELGPQTMAAIKRLPERELVEHYSAARIVFLANLPTFARFGNGWTRRVVGMAMEAAIP